MIYEFLVTAKIAIDNLDTWDKRSYLVYPLEECVGLLCSTLSFFMYPPTYESDKANPKIAQYGEKEAIELKQDWTTFVERIIPLHSHPEHAKYTDWLIAHEDYWTDLKHGFKADVEAMSTFDLWKMDRALRLLSMEAYMKEREKHLKLMEE